MSRLRIAASVLALAACIATVNACASAGALRAERLAVDAAQIVCVALPEQEAPICARAVELARALVDAQARKDAGAN